MFTLGATDCDMAGLLTIMGCAICGPLVIMPGGGLAWDMRGVATMAGLDMGVAWDMLGVTFCIRGVLDGWLC